MTRTAQAVPGDAPAARQAVVPAEQDLGWHLGVLLRTYQHSVEEILGELPHGARGYQVLVAVVHGDQPNQVALAEHLGIDRTVMTYLIDDLVEAGLVERQQNPADRRARKVVGTAQGQRMQAELQRRVRLAEDRLLGVLDGAEQRSLRAMLQRVACAVRELEPDTGLCELVGGEPRDR